MWTPLNTVPVKKRNKKKSSDLKEIERVTLLLSNLLLQMITLTLLKRNFSISSCKSVTFGMSIQREFCKIKTLIIRVRYYWNRHRRNVDDNPLGLSRGVNVFFDDALVTFAFTFNLIEADVGDETFFLLAHYWY